MLDAVLAQPKRFALLVYLIVARPSGFHRRDRLLALFWPDLDDARARDALSQALRFLRQHVGSNTLIVRGADEVGVDRSHVWCDVTEFREALGSTPVPDTFRLYGGSFLDGFFVDGVGEFDAWVDAERDALRELAARGARQLAEAADVAGHHTDAVSWGRRAFESSPDDERAFRRLLGLLDRSGDRSGALQAYDAFAQRLRTQYGAEPAPETKAMVEALARNDSPRPSPQPRERPVGDLPAPPVNAATDRYVIERQIGAGGTATVYLARDVRHDRQVAVKVLRPEIAALVGSQVLLREMAIAASLQHPHIVPLFDSGERNGEVFYVMPYIAGESLRARLDRHDALPFETTLRIARDVADALGYAHGRGFVHRDIKPENILLVENPGSAAPHTWIADFGIARALDDSARSGGWPTPMGPVGTPGYMPPEQAVTGHVDARADVYAWGVVTYEMLMGAPPTPRGTDQRAPLGAALRSRLDRVTGPGQATRLTELVIRCFDADPEARPEDGRAIVRAIEAAFDGTHVAGEASRSRWRRTIGLSVAATIVVAAVTAWAAWQLRTGRGTLAAESSAFSGETAALDTARYAILPFSYDPSVSIRLSETDRLRDRFASWIGVSLVDEFQQAEVLSRQMAQTGSVLGLRRLVAALGAGRYVRGDVRKLDTALRVHAAVYDTRTNALVRDTTVRMPSDASDADSLFGLIANHLLFGATDRHDVASRMSTRSLPARQAFTRAQEALSRWDLVAADSQFLAATEFDSRYTGAWLWLAQVRHWRRSPVAEWRYAVDQVVARRDQLSARERSLADALVATARGDLPTACGILSGLTRADRFDFTAWWAVSDCLARDGAVVPDPKSPSGWRFRTSYHESLLAYRRALELFPSIHRALRANAFEGVRVRLKTSGQFLRRGTAVAPDTGEFYAYPGWNGDTLAFIPFSAARFARADSGVVPATLPQAVRNQRQIFHEVALSWASAFPDGSDAQEALAISAQMLGDASAIDTVRRARRFAVAYDDRVRLAALEASMRVQFALPDNVGELRRAHVLADSLLRDVHIDSIADAGALVGVAALMGHADLAASLSSHRSVTRSWGIPAALSTVVPPLVVFAAFGGPVDSLTIIEQRFEDVLATRLLPEEAVRARDAWLTRASYTAFPEFRFRVLAQPARAGGLYLQDAVRAFVSNRPEDSRRILRDIARARRNTQPESHAIDAVRAEAELLGALGDSALAASWIAAPLEAIAVADPALLAHPVRSAALVRLIALRATLAARAGRRAEARRWATGASVLWSDADAFLQPTVRQMRELAK